MISFVLNSASVQKKVQLQVAMRCHKGLLEKREGSRINDSVLKKRIKTANMELIDLSLEELKSKYGHAL